MALDLFTPVVPVTAFHPAFGRLIEHSLPFNRAVQNQWVQGFVDRDGKFVKEFQTTFDSSFWELYLFAVFKELGLKCDLTKSRPDFCVVSPSVFSVEAVVSLNAEGTTSVCDATPLESPQDLNEFNRQAIIRLLNSFDAKHRKYSESYSKLEHVRGKPFVLAIAPFDRPKFQLQAQRAIEAVLYRYYVDEDSFLQVEEGSDHPLPQDMEFVTKDSGTKLPLGIFCDKRMSGISAVIQSTSGTWSKVTAMSDDPDVIIDAVYEDRREGGVYLYRGPNALYKEHLLDGLRVYHNPYADHPLDPELFGSDAVFQATSAGVANLVPLCPAKRLLVCRHSTRFQPGTMEKMLQCASPDMSYWHKVNAELYRENRKNRLRKNDGASSKREEIPSDAL